MSTVEIASVDMPDFDSAIAGFLEGQSREVNAIAAIVITVVIAQAVDRTLARRGGRISAAMSGGPLTPVMDTRLRLVRRLLYAAIIVVGVAFALSAFPTVRRVATGVLASSAVVGIVVGFAARQSIANAVAGIGLAITQPIRIGDLVTFEGQTGTVEDIRLTYTHLRAADGRRIIVPNERLAQSTIENHTIVDPRVHVEVSLWLPLDADVTRALAILGADPDAEEVEVAEVDKEGVRVVVRTWAKDADERGPVAARIRARSLERLRSDSISSDVER
jgi:small-conductance mechanosensitive channel